MKKLINKIKYKRLSNETKYLIDILNNSGLYLDDVEDDVESDFKSDFITVNDDTLFEVCYDRMMIIAYCTEISWRLDDQFDRDVDVDFEFFNAVDHCHMLDEKYIITAIESSKFSMYTIKILN